jgi:YhcH/YjgK/YiaL family protein
MILDSIDHCRRYTSTGALFEKAFDHILKTDFTKLPLGKYNIEGDDLFVILMEYETKAPSDCVMENHKKYVDIQFLVRGEEFIGITTYNGQVPITPYDETKEAAFYQKDYQSVIRLQQNHFAVFFPQDLHMPCMKTEKPEIVRKAVYKLRYDGK